MIPESVSTFWVRTEAAFDICNKKRKMLIEIRIQQEQK